MSAKPPIDPVRWKPPQIDPLPDVPSARLTVVPLPGDAPEDVVVDADGNLWTGLVDGRIVRLSPGDAPKDVDVVATTEGRPLGLHVAHDGRILVCTSPGGLLALDPAAGRLDTLVADVGGRRLTFCSNVTQSPDGTIYFTESTSAFSYAHFKGAAFEARPRGSLFRLDADGTAVTVVAGLYFANGVTPTADGSALVFAETLGRRLSKYWLTGERAGTVTPLVENLPGMPDNLSTGADGRIWCAMVSPPSAAAEWLAPRSPLLRRLLWRLPDRLQPTLKPEVWAVAFDPDSGEAVAGVRTEHPRFGLVTGLVEAHGRLWMGTIGFPALAHCPLPAPL
ncbi:gluconolactonase [Mycolicibacterium phlei]|uniref:Strictosidine synthase n=1 Tax=Mycolicibacterium phlei DSM 43239 = CCUG 21000 TaxID=1226750 RepID=A0A5N5V3X5_MYCPH|nr:SMP-30/gluconolactonase/LRE family protein [Mycolicibacterium phlei]VEG08443.1 gluconolactonase [Mycobacteroides chelonae]AMO60323.1 Virginiamycin B lyase [Mycolicibacterium phlei]EID17792.1 gluconolactonase [Mycolicibacterium phlei RIVM601174]KAB7756634.1 strictosidine synthase [Mycolicibacterium phlei DSM 43239 = CCUG 21000]KXW62111.1 strictosidine synthase [Mycolicibacterium phlei DSM 43070]